MPEFRELPAHRLSGLGDEQLVDYMRAARAAGRHDAMRPAVAVLVHGYWGVLVNRARLKLRTDADAEEVAAEAVASAIASAFDGRSIGEFRSWLHTILSRRIADWWEGREQRLVKTVLPSEHLDDEEVWGREPSRVAEEVQRSLAGASGLWPALLPRLRARARLRRAELVSQLAARLGAESRQDKVGLYYHQMEQGLLPEAGVSDTVLEALGRIVGYPADGLRKAGGLPAPGPPRADAGAVFARATYGSPAEPPSATPAPEGWDEVDRLFRGGP